MSKQWLKLPLAKRPELDLRQGRSEKGNGLERGWKKLRVRERGIVNACFERKEREKGAAGRCTTS